MSETFLKGGEGQPRLTLAAYEELLLKTSLAGRFPAREGKACLYRMADGRGCAIGVALPNDVAAKCETLGSMNADSAWAEARPYLPAELSREMASDIQVYHDSQLGAWDHNKFAARIRWVFAAAAITNTPKE